MLLEVELVLPRHSELCHRVKPARKVDFIRCSALDPGPAVSLPAAGEGQVNATRLGLCRTDTDEPTVVGSSAGDRDADE